jgi:hypothetical protein
VIRKGLQRNPEDRYQSALEYADAFTRAAASGYEREGKRHSASRRVGEMMRTRRTLTFGTVAVLSWSALASAQQVRPYQPAFDITDYAIAIDLPDTGATIRAQATLSVSRTLPRDTLVLDLLDLTVNGVTVDGRSVRFARGPATIAIPLPKRSGTRVQYKVSIDYGGAVTDGLIARADSWATDGHMAPDRAPLDSSIDQLRQGDGDVAHHGPAREDRVGERQAV